jgi:PAS domain S-box-containing protein
MEQSNIEQLIAILNKENGILSEAQKEHIVELITQNRNDRHSRLLQAVAKASVILTGSSDPLTLLDEVFELVGKAAGVDRAYYFENFEKEPGSGGIYSRQLVEWVRKNITSQIANEHLQNLSQADYSNMYEYFLRDEPYIAIVGEIKDTRLRNLFESQDILSILQLPLYVNGRFYGFIGFDDCTGEKTWTADEISALKILATHLTHLFEKNHVKLQLEKTYREAKIGTWRMDLEDDAFYWSPITREIFELSPNDLINRELASKVFKNKSDLEKVLIDIEESIESGLPYSREFEITTLKGNQKWVKDIGQVEYRNGKAIHIHGTVQDITDIKRAEIESEKNKKLLEAITDQAQVSILVRRINGEHLFVNKAWKTQFGFENKKIAGTLLHDIFEPEIADHITETDKNVLSSGKQQLFEERVKTVNGDRYFMVNKFPITGIPEMEDAIGGIGTDITEMKEAQKRLLETEQKLRDVVEHSTNLFYTHDVNHNLTYVSPQSLHFFGCTPDEAMKRWTEFATDHPVNEKGFDMTMKAIESGEPQLPYELELRKVTGETIWVEVNEAPIVKDDETVLITGSLTDITDRKKIQTEVENSLKEKETLLAEIHHRVKNNLAVVASMMQMKAHVTDDEKLMEGLLESVMRIKSMANIHEYLYRSKSFSNIDFSGNLEGLITDVIHTMQYETEITANFDCMPVYLTVNQAIPCSLIVNEVVTNIVKHAFKGRRKGNVTTRLVESEGEIHITIGDDGIGLPADFSVENSTTLGMQLIKTLTEQLNACCNYSSEGNGCQFSLSFYREKISG